MGYLLPIITELMQGITDEQIFQPNPETDEAKSFRSVWFYCVLFKFVERERWRSDWFACVKRIAHKMPVLIAKKVYNFKQMELELDTLCKGTFTEKVRIKFYILKNKCLSFPIIKRILLF